MDDEAYENNRLHGKYLLWVDNITKSFSGLTALFDVSFGIERGSHQSLNRAKWGRKDHAS